MPPGASSAEQAVLEPASQTGLSSADAARLLAEQGPNTLPEEHRSPWLELARRFWGPVPWMLEAALVLELVLGRHVQTGVIAALLVTNAVIAFLQEQRASAALALLRQRLEVQVRALRDGVWASIPSRDLVTGDLIHLRGGDLVPADGALRSGHVLVDAAALTGESLPRELSPGEDVHAGSIVVRGEADVGVRATGTRTRFGRTAELVRVGGAPGHIERVVVSIAKALVALDVVLVLAVVAYALAKDLEAKEIIPYCLILLVASVPVALPATFSLALALGARELAQHGVLVTRLAALEDVAGMEVLCTDKTGTLTQNQLAVAAVHPFGGNTADGVLGAAALASDASTQDPLDLAILRARRDGGRPLGRRLEWVPFDPATRRSEAIVDSARGRERIVKGAPKTLASLAGVVPPDFDAQVEALAGTGQRVLAVARGSGPALELIGLVGLGDGLRPDSVQSVQALRALGVRVVMATGDVAPTALSVAREAGISERGDALTGAAHASEEAVLGASVLAGVYPEDKFRLIRAHQAAGHITGMTGDGVNDAPALKQAEVGVAVSNAVDVAKASASLVLTTPGLSGIPVAIEAGRRVFQRMRTYTLNKVVKTVQVAVYLTVGLFWTGEMIVTPRLILLLLFANDFVTMSLSADNASASTAPEKWDVRALLATAAGLATGWLAFAFVGLALARSAWHLPLAQLQTLGFLMLVFTGQATVYLAREKRRFWSSLPGRSLLIATGADLAVVMALAVTGTWMAKVSLAMAGALLGGVLAGTFALDEIKTRLLSEVRK